jgi:hypothetical protein
VPLAIPIVVLLALLVSMGMAASQRQVSGGFVNWAAQAFKRLPLLGGFSIDQIVKMDRYITHQLGRLFASVEGQGIRWFVHLAEYVNVVGYWSLYWPIAMYHEVTKLLRHDIPRAVDARTKPLARRVDAAEASAKATAGYAHSFPKKIHAVDRTKEVTRIQTVAMPHAGEWRWVHNHFDALRKAVATAAAGAIGVALPHGHSFPIPWRGAINGVRRRLKALEYFTAATGAAVLVARALCGVSAQCVKKGNIGRAARRWCGLDSSLVDTLLLDGLAIFGALSVVEFANELRAVEDEALKIVGDLVAEWPS